MTKFSLIQRLILVSTVLNFTLYTAISQIQIEKFLRPKELHAPPPPPPPQNSTVILFDLTDICIIFSVLTSCSTAPSALSPGRLVLA